MTITKICFFLVVWSTPKIMKHVSPESNVDYLGFFWLAAAVIFAFSAISGLVGFDRLTAAKFVENRIFWSCCFQANAIFVLVRLNNKIYIRWVASTCSAEFRSFWSFFFRDFTTVGKETKFYLWTRIQSLLLNETTYIA